jgi:acetyltransferase-like isoleucine patch superfamily enzyme
MKVSTIIRRFLIPGWYVTLASFWRFRAQVSPRAEVELSRNLRFGRGTVVSSFTKVKAADGVLRTGSKVRIATGCFLDAHAGGISIGDGVLIGPNCVIVAVTYVYSSLGVSLEDQGQTSEGITVGNNVFIGANCVLVDGSKVGDDVIITPGSVVFGSVPARSVVSGNPAKVVFKRR